LGRNNGLVFGKWNSTTQSREIITEYLKARASKGPLKWGNRILEKRASLAKKKGIWILVPISTRLKGRGEERGREKIRTEVI